MPAELKPCFLDLDSPIYVDVFARLVRETRRSAAAGEVLLTEMLPDLTQTWLTDAAGNRYTCELRLAAIEAEEPPGGRSGSGSSVPPVL